MGRCLSVGSEAGASVRVLAVAAISFGGTTLADRVPIAAAGCLDFPPASALASTDTVEDFFFEQATSESAHKLAMANTRRFEFGKCIFGKRSTVSGRNQSFRAAVPCDSRGSRKFTAAGPRPSYRRSPSRHFTIRRLRSGLGAEGCADLGRVGTRKIWSSGRSPPTSTSPRRSRSKPR